MINASSMIVFWVTVATINVTIFQCVQIFSLIEDKVNDVGFLKGKLSVFFFAKSVVLYIETLILYGRLRKIFCKVMLPTILLPVGGCDLT